jgi:hypothetical protein
MAGGTTWNTDGLQTCLKRFTGKEESDCMGGISAAAIL